MKNCAVNSAVIRSPARRGLAAFALVLGLLAAPGPVAAQYQNRIAHNPAACEGSGPAVEIAVSGVKSASGKIRVQLYRGTEADWMEKGKWLNRIELPARAGRMTVCMPVPGPGTYAIAVRHDVNANGKTDLTQDGGGMSNNPSINVFNLGKPSYRKTAFAIGNEVKPMQIAMKYL